MESFAVGKQVLYGLSVSLQTFLGNGESLEFAVQAIANLDDKPIRHQQRANASHVISF